MQGEGSPRASDAHKRLVSTLAEQRDSTQRTERDKVRQNKLIEQRLIGNKDLYQMPPQEEFKSRHHYNPDAKPKVWEQQAMKEFEE